MQKNKLPLLQFKHNSTKNLSHSNKESLVDSIISKYCNTTQSQDKVNIGRIKKFSDISYLQKRQAAPLEMSQIIKDPLAYKSKFAESRSNLYLTIYKMNAEYNFERSIDKLENKVKRIELNESVEGAKLKTLNRFVTDIALKSAGQVVPANRQQVIDLQVWLDGMLAQLKTDPTLTTQQLADKMQIVISTCVQELIKQVTSECKERGNLLQHVWNYHIELIEKIIQSFLDSRGELEITHLQHISQIQNQNIEETTMLKQNQQLYLNRIDDLEAQMAKQTKTETLYQKKITQLGNDIYSMYNQLEDTKKQLHKAYTDLMKSKTGQSSTLYITEEVRKEQTIKVDVPQGQTSIVAHLLDSRTSKDIMTRPDKKSSNRQRRTQEMETDPTEMSEFEKELNKKLMVQELQYFNCESQTDEIIIQDQETNTDDLIMIVNQENVETKVLNSQGEIIKETSVASETSSEDDQFKMISHAVQQVGEYSLIEGLEQEEFREQQSNSREGFYDVAIQTELETEIAQLNQHLDHINDEIMEEQELSDQYQRSLYSIRSISIPDKDKEELIEILQKAQNRLQTYHKQFDVIQSTQQQIIDKQNDYKEDDLKARQTVEQMEGLLQDTVKEFIEILRAKKSKIKELKKSKSKLILKLTSSKYNFKLVSIQSEQQLNSQRESKKASPNNQTHFDFKDTQAHATDPPSISLNANNFDDIIEENIEESRFMDSPKIEQSPTAFMKKEKYTKIQQIIKQFQNNKKSLFQRLGPHQQSPKPGPKLSFMGSIGQEKRVKRVYSQNSDSANQLLKDILKIKMKQPKILLTSFQINKIVLQVFTEAMKNNEGYKIPLHIGIYDFFLKKYGFKNVAEKKIKQLLSCIAFLKQKNLMMSVFARLCNMEEETDETVYKIVLDAVRYFQAREIQFNKSDILLPQELVLEYINDKISPIIGAQIAQLVNQYKLLKIVPIDKLLSDIIVLYDKKKTDYQQILSHLFQAADLDGNKLIQFSEFKILYRAIHPRQFTKDKALMEFLQYADYIEENSKNKMITLPRFTEMAIELSIFQPDKVSQYSEGFETLFEAWESESDQIEKRFFAAEKIGEVRYMFSLLKESIGQLKLGKCTHDTKILWISFKLLAELSKKAIVNYETRSVLFDILPIPTVLVYQQYRALEEFSI